MQGRVLLLGLVLPAILFVLARPDSQVAAIYVARAKADFDRNEYNDAIAWCNRALAINPKSAAAYTNRAAAWQQKGDDDKAMADLKQALAIMPDDWEILNNLGVQYWKMAQKEDKKAEAAEAAGGNEETARACRWKSAELKDDAISLWTRGIKPRPTARDVFGHGPYIEDLETVERRIAEAVRLNPRDARAHNNLGRMHLRRSQECDRDARAVEAKANDAETKLREAEARAKTDPVAVAMARQLKGEADIVRREARLQIAQLKAKAKERLNEAIQEFEEAVELDPTMLEARLNLGEVYTQLKQFDKADAHYRVIVKYRETLTEHAKDPDIIANFSQAYFGLARIAFTRGKSDEAFAALKQAIEVNPGNMAAMELMAQELFRRGNYREGEQVVWVWLGKYPPKVRPSQAERFGAQFANEKKMPQAVRAWGIAAWIFATSPDPKVRNPQEAGKLAEQIVKMTKEEDPRALDTLAAAAAANGRFDIAVRAAQNAIDLANSQGNKPLADLISLRLAYYQRQTPYRSRPDGSDRP